MSGPPDPSQPDQMTAMVEQIVMGILADPTRLPDQFTSWLATYSSLTAQSGPQPVIGAAVESQSGPPAVSGLF